MFAQKQQLARERDDDTSREALAELWTNGKRVQRAAVCAVCEHKPCAAPKIREQCFLLLPPLDVTRGERARRVYSMTKVVRASLATVTVANATT